MYWCFRQLKYAITVLYVFLLWYEVSSMILCRIDLGLIYEADKHTAVSCEILGIIIAFATATKYLIYRVNKRKDSKSQISP